MVADSRPGVLLRIPMQLEKNDVVPTSSQDEALARYSVSREVACSVLKWETVLGSLDATPKVPCTWLVSNFLVRPASS